jgi:hypothetical protein
MIYHFQMGFHNTKQRVFHKIDCYYLLHLLFAAHVLPDCSRPCLLLHRCQRRRGRRDQPKLLGGDHGALDHVDDATARATADPATANASFCAPTNFGIDDDDERGGQYHTEDGVRVGLDTGLEQEK